MNNQDIINYVMDPPHNTNPTILKQKLNEQDFENRSDWNQNDSTKPDYVKNRTHYTEVTEEILFDGDVVFHHNAQPQTWYPLGKTPIIEGDIYKVNWNGVVFECQANLLENYVGFGNPYVFKPTVYADQDNGMPFYVLYAGGALTCGVLTPEIKFSVSFCLSRCEEVVHKIPEKYLPDSIGGGAEYDMVIKFNGLDAVITTGSYESVTSKIRNGEYPNVACIYAESGTLDDYNGTIFKSTCCRFGWYGGHFYVGTLLLTGTYDQFVNQAVFEITEDNSILVERYERAQ